MGPGLIPASVCVCEQVLKYLGPGVIAPIFDFSFADPAWETHTQQILTPSRIEQHFEVIQAFRAKLWAILSDP
eukprot:3020284-Prymnesium_polylepis.1